MAVLKKSSTGRSLQFITDDGVVYQLSAKLFGMVVNGQISGDFVVLTRMPLGVPADRFPKSPVYGDANLQAAVNTAGSRDSFSSEFLLTRKEQHSVKDVEDFKVKW
jgi:hypothetical protein